MMNGTLEQPLTEDDLVKIEDAIAACDNITRQINRATQAGIDMGPRLDDCRERRQKLVKLKAAYFPGR